jgi:hypothetical protein
MFTTSRWRWLILLTAVAALPVALLATHSWNGYHWARQSNPFTLKLGDNVNSTWDPILATTSSDWSLSTVLSTTIVPGSANPKNCRPTSGRVQVCDSTYGNTGWLGVAQIWVSGSHITQGTVKLNDTYFNTAKYNTIPWRNLVSCQEVGHTLGLDHQDTNFNNANLGTCMDYTNDPTGTAGTNGTLDNEHPNQHDYDELVTIYTHVDSTTTVGQALPNGNGQGAGQMPPAMTGVDYADPSQWGREIRGSRAAGYSVYDLDFGHGNHIFTFVTWAR